MKNILTIKKVFIRLFALSVILIISSWTINKISNKFDFGSLKNKSYYTTLFSQAEQTELANADTEYLKGKSLFFKADTYYKKADGYEKISKNSKAKKYRKRAIKKSKKAYKYFFKASDIKFHIYSGRLNKMDNDNSKKLLKAEELGINARGIYLEGLDLQASASSLQGKEKIDKLKEAFNKHIDAIKKQETAFALYMNDKDVDYNKTNDEVVIDNNSQKANKNINKNNNKTNYKPNNKYKTYQSKEEEIVSNLNITNADKLLLEDAKDKRAYAEKIMKESDKDYNKVKNIRKQASLASSEYDRNMKNKMAEGIEDALYDKILKASNMFYEADNVKFKVYSKYLPEARKTNSFKEGKKYEANSISLQNKAKQKYNKTQFYSGHKSNKYVQLMDAVQLQLSAIQEQENAFSTYFKQKTTPLDEVVETHKPIKIKPGKINDHSKSKNYNYNNKGTFVYSVNKPTPKKIIHKKGIVFKVQVGLFKDLLSLKEYGKYSPISYDTYKNNNYKRFMLGEFKSFKAAEYVLNEVKNNGISDAYIVSFVDGKRKTATYGMSRIVRNNKFEEIEANEMKQLTGKTISKSNEIEIVDNTPIRADENINKENKKNIQNKAEEVTETNEPTNTIIDDSSIKNINSIKGLFYTVQLGNFSQRKSSDDFNGASPIFYENNGATTRYTSGMFSSYENAKKKSNELKQNGNSGTFVIAYNNGRKISLADAKSISNVGNEAIATNNNNIYFAVQISAFSHKLNETEMQQFSKISQKYNINLTKIDEGLYLYTIGKYKTYKHAANVKKDIKNMNYDGFVIAFKNGKKISAKQAIELLK